MKTKRKPQLSKSQNQRLGGLITVLCGREPYPWLVQLLEQGEFVERDGDTLVLNKQGQSELERLMTLCGLAMFYRNGVPEIHATSAQRSPDVTG